MTSVNSRPLSPDRRPGGRAGRPTRRLSGGTRQRLVDDRLRLIDGHVAEALGRRRRSYLRQSTVLCLAYRRPGTDDDVYSR